MSKRNLWIIIVVLSLLLLRSWLSDDAPDMQEPTDEVAVQPTRTVPPSPVPPRVPAARPAPTPWQPPASAQPGYSQRDYYSQPPVSTASPYAFPTVDNRNTRPMPRYQSPTTPSYETAQTDSYSLAPTQPLRQPWEGYYGRPSQEPPAPPTPPEHSQPRGRWTGNYSQQAPQWQFRK